ncbi:MAG: FAD-binding oxidoreductase [Candidatus Aminicenantes bacterium]|nr:FAD-binding oxidoreductase [Candidatus Aminicenantes bacterium]MBL7082404.1 FAD-binding oxidoreductase [Candidatus Aminicenantes bacterium]
MYKKITQKIVEELEKIVGRENLTIDSEKMVDYSHDEFSLPDIARMPELVIKPKKTEEVAEIMRLANKEKIPVTPRGGATGLCGGCVPSCGGVVLSLEGMNRFIEVDRENQMAVVEAGVTLMDFYETVEEAGLFFPPHPGEESAMIGGVIATNAGGARAVKYGVIRNYVRGLEVVLPSGDIVQLGGKLMKSSTGYSLLNLIIGSEGTLGIITKATIQLMHSPQVTRSLIIPYENLENAIETVPFLIKQRILPLAVEFVPREVIQITEEFLKKKWPCSLGNTYLLIILDASNEEEMGRLSEAVAEVCMEKGALDVFVADSPKKQKQVLDIRSKIYEAIKANVLEVLDIVIPRAEIARHVKIVRDVSQKYGIWLPTYGHAADGNVHTHIMAARFEKGNIIPLSEDEWKSKFEKVREELYRDCKSRGGMISGEHGIGIVKKSYLPYVLDEEIIVLMKGIKNLFDPKNILNPGKIFD